MSPTGLETSPAVGGFCPVVVNPGRLEILTALVTGERQQLEFVPLRRLTRLTDGNLASHAKRLQSAGLIEVDKRFRDGKPVTSFTLTTAGREALNSHIARLMSAMTPGARAAEGAIELPAAVEAEQEDDSAEDDWID